MAVIKHADTSVIRANAPMFTDTRITELIEPDDTLIYLKIGRYRIGLTARECDEVNKHAKLMREMRNAATDP